MGIEMSAQEGPEYSRPAGVAASVCKRKLFSSENGLVR